MLTAEGNDRPTKQETRKEWKETTSTRGNVVVASGGTVNWVSISLQIGYLGFRKKHACDVTGP